VRGLRRWTTTDISDEVALAAGDAFGQSLDREVVGGAIATLSADHQVVIALRFYRDLTIDQIAARLGIPPGTVQSRLHYALRGLRSAIEASSRPPSQGVHSA